MAIAAAVRASKLWNYMVMKCVSFGKHDLHLSALSVPVGTGGFGLGLKSLSPQAEIEHSESMASELVDFYKAAEGIA
eukprot:3873727-Amphidinium_carterae.2